MAEEASLSTVESLPLALSERALRTLCTAFDQDPMIRWIFPDPEGRTHLLPALFQVPFRYGLQRGHVTHAHEGRGVAVWFAPERPVTVGGLIRSGMLTVPLRTGFRPWARFLGANGVMEKIHKRYVPEPHWYLLAVGVDPELQGKGIGTALLSEGLARADEAGTPCYLETSEPSNVPFYERLGFVVLEDAALGKGGPKGWGMRREPGGTD